MGKVKITATYISFYSLDGFALESNNIVSVHSRHAAMRQPGDTLIAAAMGGGITLPEALFMIVFSDIAGLGCCNIITYLSASIVYSPVTARGRRGSYSCPGAASGITIWWNSNSSQAWYWYGLALGRW